MMVNSIFYLAWQESAISEIDSEDNKKYYNDMFFNYFRLQFSSMFVLMAVTIIIFSILVDPSYWQSYNYIPYLYLGVVFYSLSSFLGVIYDAKKETHKSSITALIGAIMNVIINILLIKKIGIQAASFSTMFGFFCMFILRYFDIKKYTNLKMDYKLLALITIFTIISINVFYRNSLLFIICKVIISIIIFIIINIKLIKKILKR